MGGQDTAQQPGGGAGIAHIKDVGGFGQAADAATRDSPCAVGVASHLGPQGAHGGGGAQNVLAGQKTGNTRFTDCQCTKHQGSMTDRFIARNGDGSIQRSRRFGGDQRGCGNFIHGSGPVCDVFDGLISAFDATAYRFAMR